MVQRNPFAISDMKNRNGLSARVTADESVLLDRSRERRGYRRLCRPERCQGQCDTLPLDDRQSNVGRITRVVKDLLTRGVEIEQGGAGNLAAMAGVAVVHRKAAAGNVNA